MKLVVVPAEDDRLAGAAVKIIDNDGMVEVVEILFKTVHFHLFDLDDLKKTNDVILRSLQRKRKRFPSWAIFCTFSQRY